MSKGSSYKAGKSPYKFHCKHDTEKKNVNAAYRTETESEQEHYLYAVKENNREEIFANIDCVDTDGDKTK